MTRIKGKVCAVLVGALIGFSESEYLARIALIRTQLAIRGNGLTTDAIPLVIAILVAILLWPRAGMTAKRYAGAYLVTLLLVVPLCGVAAHFLGLRGTTSIRLPRTSVSVVQARQIADNVAFPVFVDVSSRVTALICNRHDAPALRAAAASAGGGAP